MKAPRPFDLRNGRRAAPEEEEKPSETARPRAYDLRWAAVTAAAAAAAGIGAGSQQRQHKEPGNAVEDDHAESDESSDKTRWPEQPASKPDSRAGRSDAGTERTTKFSEAPVSERSSRPARSPEREYIFTERIVEPAGRQWERERSRDVPGRRYVETRELFSTSKGSRAGSTQPTSQPSRNYRAIYREVKAGDDSEHSSGRVRFASKVDVSPTPPDSEASSTQFRMIGARPGSRRKVVAEGGERERGEDLIVEYEERRGRSRARDRARSGGVGEGQKQEYFYERKGVESSRSRCDGAEDPSERSGGGSPEKREPKPLARAFSESPSRELHSEAPAWANEDGFRPYRPEMLRPNSRDIDSLEVGSGSGHGEDRGVKHSAHGRWQEDLPVLEGYGW
ncbi:hypothetical protein B0A55_09917 [Friedmanniomyces simplex]|uniref:Uncharacterized protein n=1 Tax=Friedmanniomyces simplex TaxID=329884 RepID=A0A4U0WSU5_9PEZI|nr:hypothetical protein B0A55_09917 [Friedmanniomyces simplex]